MNKIPLKTVLKNIIYKIEKELNIEVVGIKRVVKVYGSNSNSFTLNTLSPNDKSKLYFLKFCRSPESIREIDGINLLSKYIPTSKVVLYYKSKTWKGLSWILFEFQKAKLLSEKLLDCEIGGDLNKFLELEKQKEKYLINMYKATEAKLSFSNYIKTNANDLFGKRLFGERYKSFYGNNKETISKYFDYKICLNGYIFPRTINEVFKSIKDKYKQNKSITVKSYLGHGDAHNGNILSFPSGRIIFIDPEYAGRIPAFMEFSKPYYNDLIGSLFFHYEDLLRSYFKLSSYSIKNNKLNLKFSKEKILSVRLKTTKLRLKSRENILKDSNKKIDFLSLNDYLIMCHTLNRNPNLYSEDIRYLFLVFTLIFNEFNPFEPDSIYRYF